MTEKSSIEIFDENYAVIKEKIAAAAKKSGRNAEDITLLAATKTVDVNTVNYAIKSGITCIGENRVQEFLSKKDLLLPSERHFIGHLQTNKVKDIVPFTELIHSVDSYRLASEISKQSVKSGRVSNILLEVNIGEEESKSGFLYGEILPELEKIVELQGVKVCGLMAIPPVCTDNEKNIKYFSKMYKLFIDIRDKKIDNSSMDILSMGMSDDYECAVECGATIVRIGTALFGRRNYK